MKRLITAMLVLVLTVSSLCLPLVSCGEGREEVPSDTAEADTHESPTEAVDEYGRAVVPSSVPDSLRFDGETVTVLFRSECPLMNTTVEFKSEGLNSEPVNDAVYTRNREVEAQLNIVLGYSIIDGWSHDPYLTTVRKAYQAGDASFDIMACYAYYGVSMAAEGLLANLLNQTYTDFSKPWWSRDFTEELTLMGQLYFTVGDLSLSATECTAAMFFNKKLLDDMFNGTDLYETVKNGDWTLDRYASMIETCYFDADGDGRRSRDDRYGAMMTANATPTDAYIISLGCSITEKDGDGIPQIVFGTEHDVNAFNDLFEVMIHNPGSMTGPAQHDMYLLAQEKFSESETLFLLDVLWATDYLRSTPVEYGVLPLFKYDKAQASYRTAVSDVYSLLSVFAGSKLTAQTDAVMELLAQKSYEKVTPAYFEISLKRKYSQSGQDAQMFDLVLAGRCYNFGFVYSCDMGNPTHLWRNIIATEKNTYASSLKGNVRIYSSALSKLLKKYEKLAG